MVFGELESKLEQRALRNRHMDLNTLMWANYIHTRLLLSTDKISELRSVN